MLSKSPCKEGFVAPAAGIAINRQLQVAVSWQTNRFQVAAESHPSQGNPSTLTYRIGGIMGQTLGPELSVVSTKLVVVPALQHDFSLYSTLLSSAPGVDPKTLLPKHSTT